MNVRIIATGACREVEKKKGEHDMLENTEIKRKKKKERERERCFSCGEVRVFSFFFFLLCHKQKLTPQPAVSPSTLESQHLGSSPTRFTTALFFLSPSFFFFFF